MSGPCCGILARVWVERGFHLALHVDAVRMAHDGARHGRTGGGQEACTAPLKEGARRFRAVEVVLRRRAVERRSAERDLGR